MNAVMPVLLHGQAGGGGLHFWLDQAFVVVLIAAAWIAFASIGRRLEGRRRQPRRAPEVPANPPRTCNRGNRRVRPTAD